MVAEAEEGEVVAGEAAGAEEEAEVLRRKVVAGAVVPDLAAADQAVADLRFGATAAVVAPWTAVVAAAVNFVALKVGAEATEAEPIAVATVR